MAKFLNNLIVTEVNDVVFRVAVHPFRYQSDVAQQIITAPIGFYTDFESMIRWIPTLYALLGDVAHEPAVIHDWLYYSALTTREMADNVFLEAMEVFGLSSWKRHMIYWGVRAGGWKAWNDHRNNGHPLVGKFSASL